jgi:hypothetical protein
MPRSRDLDTVAPDDPVVDNGSTPATPKKAPKSTPKSAPSTPKSEPRPKISETLYDVLGHTKHPFSAFLVKPKVFNFQEQDENEEILLVLRRHWVTNVTWILITILMVLAPLLLRFIPLLDFFPANYQFVSILFWYLITFAYAFEQFLSWYFNVYIITDERVVDIDFNNLLNKKFSEAGISMIQDVTSHVVGVSETLFNYGDVLVQTAAEIPEIVFEKVPNPEKIIKLLHQLRQEEELEAIEGRVR